MIALLRRGLAEFISFALPRLCFVCGDRILHPTDLLCVRCTAPLPALLEPVCITCGCPDARILSPGKCANCPSGTTYFLRARAVTHFSGLPQQIVHRLKYSHRREFSRLMTEAMARQILDPEFTTASHAPVSELVLVPVPLHSTRQRDRGFNQAALLAQRLAPVLRADYAPKDLRRTRATPTQTKLSKKARIRNVENAFRCPDGTRIRGRHVLLIDDVYTTGSTLNECARILLQAGAASVECYAFARATLK